MGTSLSESTFLDSVRDQNVIVNIQTHMYMDLYIYLPFSFLLFLKEITHKTRRIVDMAMVAAQKIPKQVARPIMGPEGCGSKVNTNNKKIIVDNICNKPSIITIHTDTVLGTLV